MFRVKTLIEKISAVAKQFYTPRELRALLVFIAMGLAVLIYRGSKQLYFQFFPQQEERAAIAVRKQTDSIYFALSAEANRKDSLFFSLPEDSLLPPAVQRRLSNHSKGADLRLGSISLNFASKEDLMKLPGVGSTTAGHILAYRAERGRFSSIDELTNVSGFGQKHLERVRRFLALDSIHP